jgi:hypothetical protein
MSSSEKDRRSAKDDERGVIVYLMNKLLFIRDWYNGIEQISFRVWPTPGCHSSRKGSSVQLNI